MFMPGFLIPSDLERMIPAGADPLQWAESNLLASPGALAMKNGKTFRIHTLVPTTKPDGSCIHYRKQHCQIWENAPFGCAFFGCGAKDEDRVSKSGLVDVMKAQNDVESLYSRIWEHLWDLEKRQDPPEVTRARMKE
jgi:hypothetical protein